MIYENILLKHIQIVLINVAFYVFPLLHNECHHGINENVAPNVYQVYGNVDLKHIHITLDKGCIERLHAITLTMFTDCFANVMI
jgi:hypothetical protein